MTRRKTRNLEGERSKNTKNVFHHVVCKHPDLASAGEMLKEWQTPSESNRYPGTMSPVY